MPRAGSLVRGPWPKARGPSPFAVAYCRGLLARGLLLVGRGPRAVAWGAGGVVVGWWARLRRTHSPNSDL